MRDKRTRPSGYERPIFAKLPKLKIKYKKILYWNLLATFISILIVYGYIEEVDDSIQLGTLIAVGLGALHYCFEELWEVYKKVLKDE